PPAWLWPAAIAGALVLAALAAWAFTRWRRRPGRAVAAPTAEDVALGRLERARALMEPGRAREFGAAVSDAVRLYVEDRFGLRAPRRTTEEFIGDLVRERAPALAGQRDQLADFLAHCDLAKFARLPLGPDEMEAMLGSARRFVESGRPAPEAPPDPERS
ncbi:MAG: hypothetical protein ACKOCT_06390, partial [Alphaproteobacteria bacterium]